MASSITDVPLCEYCHRLLNDNDLDPNEVHHPHHPSAESYEAALRLHCSICLLVEGKIDGEPLSKDNWYGQLTYVITPPFDDRPWHVRFQIGTENDRRDIRHLAMVKSDGKLRMDLLFDEF